MKRLLGLLLVMGMGMVGCGCGGGGGDSAPPAGEPALPATPNKPQAKVDDPPAQVAPAESKAVAEAKAAADWKVIEKAIRKQLEKPVGELTEADLEKVTRLDLTLKKLTDVPKGLEKLTQLEVLLLTDNQLTDVKGLEKLTQLEELWIAKNQLTDVKGLEKLTQLEELWILNNPDLTKAQIDELEKALPLCAIISE